MAKSKSTSEEGHRICKHDSDVRMKHPGVTGTTVALGIEPGLSLDNLFLSYFSNLGHSCQSVGESLRQLVDLDWFTDQLFTGTGTGSGYCSERSDTGQTRSEKLTVFWLFSVLPVSPWLANSPTFGRVPVSVVSGTGAASLPNETTETKTECPTPCQCSCTGIQPECMIGVQRALPDIKSGGGPVLRVVCI
ncbi:hypothetical protein J6590_013613 [Homalodisca vitripennis]|nr:hypothetical protein J6590_013613 [Homalodisca vitripennis]